MEQLRRLINSGYEKLFNRPKNVWRGTAVDRERPNPSPQTEAQAKFSAANEIIQIQNKKQALDFIQRAEVQLYAGYDYESGSVTVLRDGAIEKARNFGATEEEIKKAQDEGRMAGAMLFNWTENE